MKEVVRREVCREKNFGFPRAIYYILNDISIKVVFLFRLASYLKNKKVRIVPELIRRHLVYRYGCFLSLSADIGLGLRFPHPNGIVIGERVRIGSDCIIYQQVTVGGKRIGDAKARNYPVVGNNVTIFAGAKLIGAIIVGDCCIIGANSVVNHDIPPHSVVGGVPGRVLRTLDSLETSL